MLRPPPIDRVIVGLASPDDPRIVERLDAYRALLSDDEAVRIERFVQPADATRFLLGRVLARTLLSRFAPVAPRDWPFLIDEHGRPVLELKPPVAPDLRFNVSHTNGLVACAITVGREVGIDVEYINRRLLHHVPERFFSAREVEDLRARPVNEQDVVFFDYWTLKESYIKARGLGLKLPLRHFSFLLNGPTPTIAFAPELHDRAETWQFAQFWPSDRHRMAVAVRRDGDDLPIDVEDIVPEPRA